VSGAAGQIVQSVTRPPSRRRLLAAVENALCPAEPHNLPGTGQPAETSRPEAARILVVEDDEVSLRVAKLVLRKAGHHVDEAGDGEQAVRAVLAGHHDLVFMDCQLPLLDGLGATAEIRRRQDQGNPVRIVAMTAAAMPGDRARCLAAGMDDYLTKPVDWNQVLTRLPDWIAGPLDPVLFDPEITAELTSLPAEALTEIAEAFAATTPDTLRLLDEAVRSGDVAQAAALAHRLRSGCLTVGAVHAAALCQRIEEAAGESTDLPAVLAELTEVVRQAAEELRCLAAGTR
jgi:CheY-like chemotaxis protein